LSYKGAKQDDKAAVYQNESRHQW